jgi:protein-tyrosine phosphatase
MFRQIAEKLHTEADARAMMTEGMADLTETHAAQLGRVLARLSANATPAIVHCTAGKDRTGLTTAVLLTILGVSKDVILQDYLRSNAAMKSGAALPPGMTLPLDPAILKPLFSVEPAYLEAAVARIERQWGSFDNYRRKGLNLSDEQVARLKSIFLE